jgi:hypothetical protein
MTLLDPQLARADDDGGSGHGGSSSGGSVFDHIDSLAGAARTWGAYEVWLSDQANTQGLALATPNGTHGGKIRIYDAADLDRSTPINNPLVLDVTTDLFPDALTTTSAHVARMHGILPSPDSRYMALNFVASGHLGIVDGSSKRSVCLFRTTGTSSGRQNHMSFWTPSGNAIIVANQNGRILERVDVVRNAAGQVQEFVFNASASLDFVGGSGRILNQPIAVDMDPSNSIGCRINGTVSDNQSQFTPSNTPKQDPSRPLNTVICPIPSSNGRHAYATLGGGGMFVVDVQATPMTIVADYTKNLINAAGCGGVEAEGYMHLATGTSGPGISEFTVYRFGLDYPAAPAFNATDQPAPLAVWEDPDNGLALPGNNRDAHGMVLVGDELHIFDRVRNDVEIFQMHAPWDDLNPSFNYDLTSSGACGTTAGTSRSNDPTPDLGSVSPLSDTIYMALRGPFPLTVSHAAEGSCPGLGIIRRNPTTSTWELAHVLPASVSDFTSLKNLSHTPPLTASLLQRRSWAQPQPAPSRMGLMAPARSRGLAVSVGESPAAIVPFGTASRSISTVMPATAG